MLALGAVAAAWGAREELLREWMSPRWRRLHARVGGPGDPLLAAWGFARVVTPVGSPREIWLVSLYGQIGDPRSLQAHAPAVAAAIVVATVAEELVWRGMVTQLLADRIGSRWAWAWAAGLYALANVPTALRSGQPGGIEPRARSRGARRGPPLGGHGARFGRLAPGILAHALFDWAVVMMFPLWGGVWTR